MGRATGGGITDYHQQQALYVMFMLKIYLSFKALHELSNVLRQTRRERCQV